MKFANYYFEARQLKNLGDNIQLLAVDYLYQLMGIPAEDTIQINKNELAHYDGEYAILPVSMPLTDYVPGGLSKRFSPKIIPLFLGLSMLRDFLYPDEVEYLRQYSPIGCRDERTLETLQKHNIMCYLNGCISALLPEREATDKKPDKIFIVDTPPSLEAYIPAYIKEQAIRTTHLRYDTVVTAKQDAVNQYIWYKKEAALVITSLLHCAVPCIAAGIPVVLVKTECSYRFGWLEKLLPIYTLQDYQNIDWNPKKVEYTEHKKRLTENAIFQIQQAQKRYKDIFAISSFYEDRQKKTYIIGTFESIREAINNTWRKDVPVHYGIWGMTQLAELCVEYIRNHYPNAQLSAVYDRYRSDCFEGLTPQKPEQIAKDKDLFILVTVLAAAAEAETFFDTIGKSKNSYAIGDIVL